MNKNYSDVLRCLWYIMIKKIKILASCNFKIKQESISLYKWKSLKN